MRFSIGCSFWKCAWISILSRGRGNPGGVSSTIAPVCIWVVGDRTRSRRGDEGGKRKKEGKAGGKEVQ